MQRAAANLLGMMRPTRETLAAGQGSAVQLQLLPSPHQL
jgi:hypothetical protein